MHTAIQEYITPVMRYGSDREAACQRLLPRPCSMRSFATKSMDVSKIMRWPRKERLADVFESKSRWQEIHVVGGRVLVLSEIP